MSLVIDRVTEHYNYGTRNMNPGNVIGIFLAGSQNYGTSVENSDVDTKLLIAPTLNDVYANHKGETETIIMPDSEEHITVKDIRCALKEFKKQGNLLEILFTDYCLINPPYKKAWQILIDNRELIARYDTYLAMKAAKGIVKNTYDRLYTKDGNLNSKQVANLVRLEYFIKKYIDQYPYAECIKPEGETLDYIMSIRHKEMGDASLLRIADSSEQSASLLVETYCQRGDLLRGNPEVDDLLLEVNKEIIDTAFIMEYARNGEI